MVARTAVLKKMDTGWLRRWAVYEVEVSQNDTSTLSEFDSSNNLEQVIVVKMEDGSEMTNTHVANNVVTFTGTGSNVDCIMFALGLKS